MFKTILLATDGSDLSLKAIQSTVEFAKSHGSRIVGLCVEEIYPYFPNGSLEGIEGTSKFTDAIHQEAELNVKKIADLAKAGGVAVETHTVKGTSPHEEIIKSAKKYACDAIFMASHGRKGLDKLLLGSEAQKVLVHSTLPVMIFK